MEEEEVEEEEEENLDMITPVKKKVILQYLFFLELILFRLSQLSRLQDQPLGVVKPHPETFWPHPPTMAYLWVY